MHSPSSAGQPDEGPGFSKGADDDPLAMQSVMTSVDAQPQPQASYQTQLESRRSSDTSLGQELSGSSAARRQQQRAATVSDYVAMLCLLRGGLAFVRPAALLLLSCASALQQRSVQALWLSLTLKVNY